jgi:hypothetical protein
VSFELRFVHVTIPGIALLEYLAALEQGLQPPPMAA